MNDLMIKALIFGCVISTILFALGGSLALSAAYPIIGIPIFLVVLTLIFALLFYYVEKG